MSSKNAKKLRKILKQYKSYDHHGDDKYVVKTSTDERGREVRETTVHNLKKKVYKKIKKQLRDGKIPT